MLPSLSRTLGPCTAEFEIVGQICSVSQCGQHVDERPQTQTQTVALTEHATSRRSRAGHVAGAVAIVYGRMHKRTIVTAGIPVQTMSARTPEPEQPPGLPH